MNNIEKQQFIEYNLEFYKYLTKNEKTLIHANSHFITYQNGDIIQSAYKECMGLIFINYGELRVYISSENGRDITLYRLTKGDTCILSASCILNNINFDVCINAEQKTEVLLVDISVFAQIFKSNIYVENFALRTSVERFSDVMWSMEQILFMGFDKRLAIFLHDEMIKLNTNYLIITHEQIAKLMGSAREVVSRMLKHFELEGIVQLERGKVLIKDKEKLNKLM